ncbi:MAG: thioredoxin family protein [Psychroflexus sp.]|jgi:thioredoxin 1|nr:thioredoxin family protein [Psychroflexus sp.]MDR9448873.1 thioredoxin family protein [Psychroflexus sp.]
MTKFGNLIDERKIPVLINFYAEWDVACSDVHLILRDVAAATGDQAKVIKINVDKNQALAEALRVKSLPTFVIYSFGEMVWRKSGHLDANALVAHIKEYQPNG